MEYSARVSCPHCKCGFICVVPGSGNYRVDCLECNRALAFTYRARPRWVYRRYTPPYVGLVLS